MPPIFYPSSGFPNLLRPPRSTRETRAFVDAFEVYESEDCFILILCARAGTVSLCFLSQLIGSILLIGFKVIRGNSHFTSLHGLQWSTTYMLHLLASIPLSESYHRPHRPPPDTEEKRRQPKQDVESGQRCGPHYSLEFGQSETCIRQSHDRPSYH